MKKTIISLALLTAVFVYMLSIIGLDEISMTLSTLDVSVMLVLLAASIIATFVDCFKWRMLLNHLPGIKRPALLRLWPVFMAGEFINTLTPGAKTGGELLKAHYTSNVIKTPQSKIYATILLDKSIGMFVIFLLAVVSMVYSIFFLVSVSVFTDIFRGLLIVIAIISISVLAINYHVGEKRHETLYKILYRIYHFRPLEFLRVRFQTFHVFERFIVESYNEFKTSLKSLMGHREGVASNILLSALTFSINFFKVWFIFFVLGYNISIIYIIIVWTMGAFVSYIMLTPGGSGVTEVALVTLYLAVGVDPHIAATVAIIDRSFFYLVSLGFGYLATLYMKFRY